MIGPLGERVRGQASCPTGLLVVSQDRLGTWQVVEPLTQYCAGSPSPIGRGFKVCKPIPTAQGSVDHVALGVAYNFCSNLGHASSEVAQLLRRGHGQVQETAVDERASIVNSYHEG